jgi:hypothetical protein
VQEREILDAALRLTGPQRTPAQHLGD